MESFQVRPGALLELSVMVFQVVGVVALCVTRLLPRTRWSECGRRCFLLAMVGLAVTGSLCSRYDSVFALFAGGTMTLLLIGITTGSGAIETTVACGVGAGPEPGAVV